MSRHRYAILSFLIVLGCESNPRDPSLKTTATKPAPSTDTAIYEASWNMGQDRDEPEKSYESRFAVRVGQSSSGTLTVFLDSAIARSQSSYPQLVPADSIKITGLGPTDRFTRSCRYASGTLRPAIGILRDTVYERSGRPRFIWLLDTLKAQIRQLPTDSASCFIAGPE